MNKNLLLWLLLRRIKLRIGWSVLAVKNGENFWKVNTINDNINLILFYLDFTLPKTVKSFTCNLIKKLTCKEPEENWRKNYTTIKKPQIVALQNQSQIQNGSTSSISKENKSKQISKVKEKNNILPTRKKLSGLSNKSTYVNKSKLDTENINNIKRNINKALTVKAKRVVTKKKIPYKRLMIQLR